ncbi:polyprotein [Gentian mosaic virus]|uniref:RNA1 polyprotein n=1 Tax=Gentian mosaic virus TaxID=182452 RepID=Q4W8R6_9SECO|nr:polyprotein [Gentian mosaic virus]BAD99001.1 polyprotein [Gentian mosaic virus]
MASELASVCVGFLRCSMGLQSTKDFVEKEFAGHPLKELIYIHLCFFDANNMAIDYNSGMNNAQMYSAQAVRARFAILKSHAYRNVLTGTYDKNKMLEYNHETCVNWFDCDFVMDEKKIENDLETPTDAEVFPHSKVTPLDTQAMVGQSIITSVQKAAALILEKCAKFTTKTLENFLICLKDAIHGAFASWMPNIEQAFSWFGNIFVVLKKWASSIHDGIGGLLVGIEECLYMGVAIVSSTCIVALIEKFLVATKTIASPCNAPTLFLAGLTAAVGSTYLFTKGIEKSNVITSMMEFVSLSCGKLLNAAFGADLSSRVAEDNGQFGPGIVLESLAATMESWSTKSLHEIGRSFGAITQIKNGAVAMRDIVIYLFTSLGDIGSKILGFESQVLSDLSILLGENVADWLDECDCMVAFMLEFTSNAREIFDRLAQLIEKGRSIRAGLLKTVHRGSPQVMTLVTKALEKLTELHNSIVMAGSNGSRRAPFMVFFTGASGVGKTSVVQRMSANWLQQEQLGSNEVYARNGQDPFWSGYRRQAVVTYDDFGAVPGLVSNEAEIINVVSRNPHAVNMADLKEKGMYFDSRLIIASSNFLAANPESGVHDAEAYERRRHCVIKVTLKNGVPYNPANPCGNQEYALLDSKSPFHVLRVFETYEELWSFIYNRFKEHEENEQTFLSSLPIPEGTEADALKNLVGISVAIGSIGPQAVMKYAAQHLPGHHFLISDGDTVYFWLEDGTVTRVNVKNLGLSNLEKAELQQRSLTCALTYQNLAKLFPTINPLAVLYAKNIVKKGWILEDLSISSACTDEFMKGQIARLPEWQRAYLHVLGRHLQDAGDKGWFRNCLEETKKALRASYVWEYKKWPFAMKLAVGTLIAIFGGAVVYSLLQNLWGCAGEASFVVGAAALFSEGSKLEAQSLPPNKVAGEYLFRNKKVRVRNWEGQAPCFGDTAGWIADNCMATLNVLGNRIQVCLMPNRGFLIVNHFARAIPHGAMVQLESSLSSTYFVWERKKLTLFEGNELALYVSSMIPKVVDSLQTRVVYDAESLPESFKAIFFSYKFDPTLQQMIPEIGEIMCRKKNQTLTVCSGEYRRKVPLHLQYENSTIKGDCGSLIMVEVDGKMKLVAIHVAGTGQLASRAFIPFDERFAQTTGQSDFVMNYTEWAMPEILGPGCRVIGAIAKEHQVAVGGKTSFVETPQEWHLDTPCDKLPSVLKRNDVRLAGTANADYDPFSVGMTKYAKEAGPFDADVLVTVCEEIKETWYDAQGDFTFDEVSLEVALNGVANLEYFDAIVLSTSEGYPYRLDRKSGDKGKARFVDGEAGDYTITNSQMLQDIAWFENESKVRVPDLYCIECVKDERLPKRKVLETPKSRLFTVLPMSYNLVIRKKFLNFVRFFMTRRDVLPCQVGVNPYSREWSRIACKLLEKGNNILCCDYSRFDGFLPKCIMSQIGHLIGTFMKKDEAEVEQICNLLLACSGRYAICEKLLYRVENGIPSGFPLTVIVNSILNEILVKYAFRMCFADNPMVRESFDTHVSLVVYGDDNLISVSDAISAKFNGEFLVDFFLKLSITVTDGVDKTKKGISFRRLADCDFLKRGFKNLPDGEWIGPMSRESLWPQLHFVRAKKLEMADAYVANLNNILRELWLHSANEATELRRKALRSLKWIEPARLLTLGQIAEFYEEQRNGDCTFLAACNRTENLDLLDPLIPGQLPVATQQILPGLLVAAEKHCTESLEDYYVISLATARKFATPDDGMVISFPYGCGRGGLPTQQFMQENVIRKGCNIRKQFERALSESNKKPKGILIISQSSVVPAYVFAILLLAATGKINRVVSNLALTRATQICKSLKYLPENFPDFF